MDDYFDKLAHTWDTDPMKTERAKAAADCFKDVPLHNRKSLLDFGGGTGLLALYLSDFFEELTIVDRSGPMLEVASKNIQSAGIQNVRTVQVKENLAEVSESYTTISTLMTLHHLPNLNHFFENAAKILTSQGSLIIMDLYAEDGAFHRHINDFNGHNGFDIEKLSGQLERNGFRIGRVKTFFEIEKEISPGGKKVFPLFFLAAEKIQ